MMSENDGTDVEIKEGSSNIVEFKIFSNLVFILAM